VIAEMPEIKTKEIFHVQVIESEMGWGQRVLEDKFFDCEKDAKKFTEEFNSRNDYAISPPDWYMIALYCGKVG
jgi:hypothetical protein